MNYIDERATQIGKICNLTPRVSHDMHLMRTYAVISFAKGFRTTLKDVHDAWVAWRSDIEPDHKHLVPFNKLTVEMQQLYSTHREAIRTASKVFECDFCGKPRREVRTLINGLGVFICNECIKQCNDLLEGKKS